MNMADESGAHPGMEVFVSMCLFNNYCYEITVEKIIIWSPAQFVSLFNSKEMNSL